MRDELFIDGDWRASAGGGTLDCIDPATEEVFARVPAATAADVDAAVTAAARAFRTWGVTTGAERAKHLRAIAAELRKRRDELGALETRDNGKPLVEALYDVDTAANIFDMYAGLAEQLDGADEELSTSAAYLKVVVRKSPLGVVGLITPWNFPIEQFTWKVSAALAAGCACVVKPSEVTPMTSLMFGEIANAAGLPAGVLNIVTGTGAETGQALVEHPAVAKISFTGSTATGRKIMASAAADLKKVSLELGGKSPILVFDDVDIARAVEWVMFGAFVNQGQVCTSTSRLLLSAAIKKPFLDELKARTEELVVGPGAAPASQMGPLVSKAQYDKVMGYIEAGRRAGATLLTGGDRPEGLNAGYFVAPTVFTDVTPDMSIWREEIFGPVLSVMAFETEDEAVALANDSEYGLGAAVLTGDAARSDRVAAQLQAGIIWQDCNQIVVMEAPWGGLKKSGMGRELGRWGMEAFQETRQFTRWLPDSGLGWYAK
ncbi:aldehyde dehydrogenase family protein [Hansschlegelia plantiphila]|uniref:Betaine-aldehyde dehydrogenase n=1 Tax=Hansschlegelia plantiphila TaxID=374655 RepID=A0A9W6MWE4_9HYPH|nr:aldehyde dehydrogenase family protein [Hansschlegelia plantiphila]GLK68921.1 betaine-aldehyde dehydrogenase [Hansschlegelia plantiphila]